MSIALSGLGILFGFLILMVGAWKKVNLLIVTLATTAVIALFNGLNIAEVWTGTYMEGFTSFAGKYLLLFCFGSLFGKIIEDSGAGWRIANTIATKTGENKALGALTLVTALLLYGGVSIFVIVFFILPIGKSLFKKIKVPWYLFPGIAMIGTIPAVGMLPGTLQILNIIPTNFLGTSLTAGAGVGLVATVVYFLMAWLYTRRVIKTNAANFDLADFNTGQSIELDETDLDSRAPNVIVSLIPIAVALILINVFKMNIVIGMLLASASGIILFWKSLGGSKFWSTINTGIANGIAPVIYVSVVVGVARTVAAVPFFDVMKDFLLNLQTNGLIKVLATTSVLSAMTGSSSGSMTMILDLFSQDFLSWGYAPGLLHRLISVAALGFDSLPWNSVVVVFFTLSGVSYAKGYKHVFAYTVIMPLICAFLIIAISPIFY